ncbi:MAG: DUF58 domain-containing protein [Victivallaceae bacterium]|nr:DUF58 domain-containing protein [Victivallaceae bacterium]
MANRTTYQYLPPETLDSLRNIELVARHLVEGAMLGLHRSPYHGFSSEFAEYRKYTPGDSLKYLDWKVLARTDRYYLKRFEEETNLRSYIVLDQSASMGMSDSAAPVKFNYACYLAAAFMYLMHQQHDGVGLFTYSDEIRAALDCKSSRTHLMDLLKLLENLRPSGRSDAEHCLKLIAERIPKRSLVIIFSDFFDYQPDFLAALHHLTFKGCEVILFQILNELEKKFPYKGLIEFEDIETGATIDLESAACRDYFLKELERYNAGLKNFCDARKIAFETLTTATAFEKALLAYFSKREELF